MKKIILLITMAAVVASCNIYNEGRLMVPEAIVQNKVSKSFPITKNYILLLFQIIIIKFISTIFFSKSTFACFPIMAS